MVEYFHLLDAGASQAMSGAREASLRMGASLLTALGVRQTEIDLVQRELRDDLEGEDRNIINEILGILSIYQCIDLIGYVRKYSARKLQNRVATEKVNKFYENIIMDEAKNKASRSTRCFIYTL